jgi:hypothetical protein
MITIKHCFEQKPIYVAYQQTDWKRCKTCHGLHAVNKLYHPIKVNEYCWEVHWFNDQAPDVFRVDTRYTDDPEHCFETLAECKVECEKRNKKKKTS